MPNNLQDLFNNYPWIGGVVMAVIVSILRVVYDRKETSFGRIMLESLICGFLALAAGGALMELGYGPGWYLFCGGMTGFMGSQSIRALAYRLIRREIDDE